MYRVSDIGHPLFFVTFYLSITYDFGIDLVYEMLN